MRVAALFLIGFTLSSPVLADQVQRSVIRACRVFEAATVKSGTNCLVRAKQQVTVDPDEENGFYSIDAGDCVGFLHRGCLYSGKRTPDALVATNNQFFFGVNGDLDGSLARVSSSSAGSSGLGFGLGLEMRWAVNDNWHFVFASNFQRLSLTRTVDTGGSVTDPTPIQYTQTYSLVGLRALASYRLFSTKEAGKRNGRIMVWWVDAGGEFLYPIGASQTDSLGTTTSFSFGDKFIFAILGPSTIFWIRDNVTLTARMHAYYNVGGAGGNTLYGGRLGLALQFVL